MAKPGECQRRNSVSGGRGIVVAGFAPENQLLVIVAGEEKSTCTAILEVLEQRIGNPGCELEVRFAESRLEHLQRRGQQEGVVVHIGVEVSTAVLVCRQQSPLFSHSGAKKIQRA